MFWASMRRSFIAAMFFLVFGGTLALAQSGTTSLRGTVLDKSGAAIVRSESNAVQRISRPTSRHDDKQRRGI